MSAQPKRNARPKRAVAPRVVPIALRTTPALLTKQLVKADGALTVLALTGLSDKDWTIVSLSVRVFATAASAVSLTVTLNGSSQAWTFRGWCNTSLLPYVGGTYTASSPVQVNMTARLTAPKASANGSVSAR